VGMVFSVAAVAVLAVVLNLMNKETVDPDGPVVVTAPVPAPHGGGVDTGVPPPLPASAPVPYTHTPSVPTTHHGGGPAPAPRPSSAPVHISIPGTARYPGGVEITCPSGFRRRGAFSGQTATVADVPSESCTLYFKGGSPAQFSPVSGGSSYSCEFPAPGTAVCR